jgi:hypothetical protein
MIRYICDHADPEFSCYGCPHSVPHDEIGFCGTDEDTCWEKGILVKCVEWDGEEEDEDCRSSISILNGW